MEENVKTEELMEAMQEQLRQLEHEDEELLARHDELKNRMLVLKTTGEMLEENERLLGKILELYHYIFSRNFFGSCEKFS